MSDLLSSLNLPEIPPLPPEWLLAIAVREKKIKPYPLTEQERSILQEAEDMPKIHKEAVKRAKKHGKLIPSQKVLNNVAIKWGYQRYSEHCWIRHLELKERMAGYRIAQEHMIPLRFPKKVAK